MLIPILVREDVHSISEESRGAVQNKFVPVSQNVLACAAHPCNGTIIAGTKVRFDDKIFFFFGKTLK